MLFFVPEGLPVCRRIYKECVIAPAGQPVCSKYFNECWFCPSGATGLLLRLFPRTIRKKNSFSEGILLPQAKSKHHNPPNHKTNNCKPAPVLMIHSAKSIESAPISGSDKKSPPILSKSQKNNHLTPFFPIP